MVVFVAAELEPFDFITAGALFFHSCFIGLVYENSTVGESDEPQDQVEVECVLQLTEGEAQACFIVVLGPLVESEN